MSAKAIHVGIGGWDFDPWRGTFYPTGLPKTRQLEYAGQHLGAIEINATFYKLQRPELFERWARAVPDGFRFAIKASRFCTNRKDLAEGAESMARFLSQGFTCLGDKLGPILWQLAPTKRFDPAEMRAFLALLPTRQDGLELRHALEVRHESFRCREFVAMAGCARVAVVFADSDDYPQIADLTSDFVYARLQRTQESESEGYSAADLDRWARVARGWSEGQRPEGLDYVSQARGPVEPREVYLFVIAGAKVRNPAAAQALIARLQK
ncbi:DUF72 domain-containing protein [Sphingosinicella terrae]|uniref:DUF72 domain-containing protein n=1 Tax=Sphingosinicella terrae TaxID=2172047 RepID=UPI000E0CCAF8|nr:DUF72 domain-containing protein [Sphingosinicella terrae]